MRLASFLLRNKYISSKDSKKTESQLKVFTGWIEIIHVTIINWILIYLHYKETIVFHPAASPA